MCDKKESLSLVFPFFERLCFFLLLLQVHFYDCCSTVARCSSTIIRRTLPPFLLLQSQVRSSGEEEGGRSHRAKPRSMVRNYQTLVKGLFLSPQIKPLKCFRKRMFTLSIFDIRVVKIARGPLHGCWWLSFLNWTGPSAARQRAAPLMLCVL